MKIIEDPCGAYELLAGWRNSGESIGLVPTMGALHAGHLALVQRSRAECQRTVASVFVNPTQFAPHEDLSRYPRTLTDDLRALEELSVDVVFVPSARSMYPEGFSTYVQPPAVAQPLEGEFRPGHFQGVATVVLKLFQILPATHAYFGQKDFQQLAVIRHMASDLNVPVQIVGCPTVREADGLAMSSRNRYLQPEQRQAALSLWGALTAVRELLLQGQTEVDQLEQCMLERLREGGIQRIDYARVVDRDTLAALLRVDRPAVALIAAHVGHTRLIDNLLLPND